MRIRGALAILTMAVTAVVLTATAALAAPGAKQYVTPKVETVTTGQGVVGAAHVQTGATGTLPFTGMMLLWVIVFGAGLVMLGLVLRRRARRNSS